MSGNTYFTRRTTLSGRTEWNKHILEVGQSYVMSFEAGLMAMSQKGIAGQPCMLLTYILGRMVDNQVVIEKHFKTGFLKHMEALKVVGGPTPTTAGNIVTVLKKKNMLIHLDSSLYMVNPFMFWKGDLGKKRLAYCAFTQAYLDHQAYSPEVMPDVIQQLKEKNYNQYGIKI